MHIDIILNLALLVALTVVSGFVGHRWPGHTRRGALAQGALFGAAAVLGMLRPLTLWPGLIFDGRSVVLSLCALFFGPWAGVPAALLTGGYRIALGGVGVPMGLVVIAASTVIGLVAHARRDPAAAPPPARWFLGFGYVVHLAMLGAFFAMPLDQALGAIRRLAVPLFVFYPLATILAGRILADQQRAARSIAALRDSVARFQHAARVSFNTIWDLDVVHDRLWWNDTFYELFGYPPHEVEPTMTAWSNRIHPDDAPNITSSFEAALTSDATTWEGEYRFRRRDGSYAFIEDRCSIIRDASGRAVRALGAMQDISTRIAAEATQRLQSAALDAAANAVVITGRQGTIQWVNRAFTELTGYAPDEAIGQNPRMLNSGVHDPSVFTRLWETLLAGDTWHGQITNRRKDGSRYVEDQTITPVRDARGEITHFIAIKRDLTQEQRLEAQVQQAQKMETVGRLAGGVAHDFNNILTVINGSADLALGRLTEGDPLRDDLTRILRAGERGAALTRQLLAFSRKQIVQPVVVDLAALVTDIQPLLGRLLGEDIELLVSVDASAAPRIKVDPGQIEQVVMNLAVNARDAMPTGGRLTLALRETRMDAAMAATLGGVKPGDYVTLTVTDTGIGMDAATQERVFEPFFTTKGPGLGTGLGLATVYGIVKQSGGLVTIDSAPSRGTSVHVSLPRAEEAVQRGEGPASRAASRGLETILVVEDEDAVRHIAERMLRMAGYTVLSAPTAARALEILESAEPAPDLLLTDIVLPELDGADLAARARHARPSLKVLYMSGYTDDAVVRRGVQTRTAQFLGKPFTHAELAQKVRAALDG